MAFRLGSKKKKAKEDADAKAGSDAPQAAGSAPKKGFDPSKFSLDSIAGAEAGGRVAQSQSQAESSKPQTRVALDKSVQADKAKIQDLIASGQESAQSLKRSMVEQGVVNEADILAAVASQVGMDKINLSEVSVTPELLAVLDAKFAKLHNVFPVSSTDDCLVVAVGDPTNLRPLDDLRIMMGKEVVGLLAPEEDLHRFVQRYYEGNEIADIYSKMTGVSGDDFSRSLDAYDQTIALEDGNRNLPPAVRYVDLIFKMAVHDGASDIHIEPARTGLDIRFRTDGVLRAVPSPPKAWKNAIISRLKVMAGMDLAEKRVPQDGRIKLTLPDKSFDLRVSALPSLFGETIVMRILDQSDVIMGLEDVGFLPDSVKIFERLIRSPNGVILMTGPTGSGKTTTLNAALSTLNNSETKIITAEDPVEYMIQGINQIHINSEVGLDFSMALRSMLRMSPDIIMVGEIRDAETAEIAIRAALTGHLVFSTLHTNDAPSSTTRLIDMGVKPFLVASSIQAVIAQRLIRRVCSNCKTGITLPIEVLEEVGVDPVEYASTTFYKGAGCDRCGQTGYRGRTAIHEIFVMDSDLRKMVIRNESTIKVKKAALAKGMRSLRLDGWEKVLLGQTTVEEVMRMTQMD